VKTEELRAELQAACAGAPEDDEPETSNMGETEPLAGEADPF